MIFVMVCGIVGMYSHNFSFDAQWLLGGDFNVSQVFHGKEIWRISVSYTEQNKFGHKLAPVGFKLTTIWSSL